MKIFFISTILLSTFSITALADQIKLHDGGLAELGNTKITCEANPYEEHGCYIAYGKQALKTTSSYNTLSCGSIKVWGVHRQGSIIFCTEDFEKAKAVLNSEVVSGNCK